MTGFAPFLFGKRNNFSEAVSDVVAFQSSTCDIAVQPRVDRHVLIAPVRFHNSLLGTHRLRILRGSNRVEETAAKEHGKAPGGDESKRLSVKCRQQRVFHWKNVWSKRDTGFLASPSRIGHVHPHDYATSWGSNYCDKYGSRRLVSSGTPHGLDDSWIAWWFADENAPPSNIASRQHDWSLLALTCTQEVIPATLSGGKDGQNWPLIPLFHSPKSGTFTLTITPSVGEAITVTDDGDGHLISSGTPYGSTRQSHPLLPESGSGCWS